MKRENIQKGLLAVLLAALLLTSCGSGTTQGTGEKTDTHGGSITDTTIGAATTMTTTTTVDGTTSKEPQGTIGLIAPTVEEDSPILFTRFGTEYRLATKKILIWTQIKFREGGTPSASFGPGAVSDGPGAFFSLRELFETYGNEFPKGDYLPETDRLDIEPRDDGSRISFKAILDEKGEQTSLTLDDLAGVVGKYTIVFLEVIEKDLTDPASVERYGEGAYSKTENYLFLTLNVRKMPGSPE